MEYMHRLQYRWEEGLVNVEGKATIFWYWNPIVAVKYILSLQPFKEHVSYAPQWQIDASGEHIYAEMCNLDWLWKTQASFPLL